MVFRCQRLTFRFRALDPVSFPRFGAANAIRGRLGALLRESGCAADCLRPEACPQPGNCPYTRIFEPVAPEGSPSGFAQPPRPFVLRPRPLDARAYGPGEPFAIELIWFAVRHADWIGDLTRAFERVEVKGIAAERGRARLLNVEAAAPLELPIGGAAAGVRRATVRFLSPTELKSGSALVSEPEFPVLVARTRDRLSTLAAVYGDGPLPLDFRGLAERAASVRMSACSVVEERSAQRRSSRTLQTHSLGGFTGEAVYEGNLGEFLPLLTAAQHTGVGRQTVWGKGEIEVIPG